LRAFHGGDLERFSRAQKGAIIGKKLLLGGASALAILVAAGAADAAIFSMPGKATFTASVGGEYSLEVLGAAGGILLTSWAGSELRF
jgi:hypothetical protein